MVDESNCTSKARLSQVKAQTKELLVSASFGSKFKDSETIIYPRLGRAGLGNELFTLFRAISQIDEKTLLIAPRWGRLRVGPSLRREQDLRQYWRVFASPTMRQRQIRACIDLVLRLGRTSFFGRQIILERGMQGYFDELTLGPAVYLEMLKNMCRQPPTEPQTVYRAGYVSFHIRLGDFQRPTEARAEFRLTSNNASTPLSWFTEMSRRISARVPGVRMIVCSDGRDEELRDLLRIPGVARSTAGTVIDDLLTLASSTAIIGSRSTFTAWGAFLGDKPLVVAPGGDAYRPHNSVSEAASGEDMEAWIAKVLVPRPSV